MLPVITQASARPVSVVSVVSIAPVGDHIAFVTIAKPDGLVVFPIITAPAVVATASIAIVAIVVVTPTSPVVGAQISVTDIQRSIFVPLAVAARIVVANMAIIYENMSALLHEIIAARKSKAIEYEEYLRRIAALANRVGAGQAEDTPEQVNTPGLRALYNNLSKNGDLALKIDDAVRRVRPDGWRGIQAREQVIKGALYGELKDEAEVERIFLIIKQQREY